MEKWVITGLGQGKYKKISLNYLMPESEVLRND